MSVPTAIVSEQAASCFQWLTGFRNKQVRRLMYRNPSFSMLLKMEELLDQHAA